ncbi:hypothetical protein TorRG33x02_353980, partial [Trema orientale]
MAFICWLRKDNIPLCVTLVKKSGNITCKEAFVSRLDDIANLRKDDDDMHYMGKDDTNDNGGGGGGDEEEEEEEEED